MENLENLNQYMYIYMKFNAPKIFSKSFFQKT